MSSFKWSLDGLLTHSLQKCSKKYCQSLQNGLSSSFIATHTRNAASAQAQTTWVMSTKNKMVKTQSQFTRNLTCWSAHTINHDCRVWFISESHGMIQNLSRPAQDRRHHFMALYDPWIFLLTKHFMGYMLLLGVPPIAQQIYIIYTHFCVSGRINTELQLLYITNPWRW